MKEFLESLSPDLRCQIQFDGGIGRYVATWDWIRRSDGTCFRPTTDVKGSHLYIARVLDPVCFDLSGQLTELGREQLRLLTLQAIQQAAR